jgi:hypothetical protein
MRTDEILVAISMYLVLPLWLAAGFANYLCHRDLFRRIRAATARACPLSEHKQPLSMH